ncbi:MAG: hypothetical protein ACRD8W_01735 [Nitrososphaeraceae archaeon]
MTTIDFTSDSSQLETKFAIFVAIMIAIIIACMGIPFVFMLKNYLSDMKGKIASRNDKTYGKKKKA